MVLTLGHFIVLCSQRRVAGSEIVNYTFSLILTYLFVCVLVTERGK